MADEKKKSKKEPIRYILEGKEYEVKQITFEVICKDVAYRKDEKAKKFIMEHQGDNFLSLRKAYLKDYAQKAKSTKDKALELLNW